MADDFYSLKGFMSYGALADNHLNQVSPIGELSLRAATFARDRALYATATDTEPSTSTNLTVFSSKAIDGSTVTVPTVLSDQLLAMGVWIYRQSIEGAFSLTTESFSVPFKDQFNTVIATITAGPMVTDGSIWMPSWVILSFNPSVLFGGTIPLGFEAVRAKLWFADAAFQEQYDEFEMVFIPPVERLDDLFGYPLEVKQLLEQNNVPVLMEKIRTAADKTPYTVLRSFNFRYHNPTNVSDMAEAVWTILIWSDAGDNIDTIKQRLAQWILSQSTHPHEDWVTIFPDIFASTEFIVLPLWNQIAVPNLTMDNAMYSPVVLSEEAMTFIQAMAAGTGYTAAHIEANTSFFATAYKSLSCLAVGGPENRNQLFAFNAAMPDYLAVPTTSIDFDRMSDSTRFWCMRFFSMLQVAEVMTETSDIPAGMSRLHRLNSQNEEIMYLVSSVNDIQYLVVSKASLNTKFPPIDRTVIPLSFSPDPTVTLSTPLDTKRLQLNVSVTGGTAPYTFAASSSDIEPGGQIDPETGALDVTFKNWGANRIDVTVTDAKGLFKTVTYTVVCNES